MLSGNYDFKCDVWSIGAVLFTMLYGFPPFYDRNDKVTINKIKSGEFEFTGFNFFLETKFIKTSIIFFIKII